jgi:hypothetical protein
LVVVEVFGFLGVRREVEIAESVQNIDHLSSEMTGGRASLDELLCEKELEMPELNT